MNKSRDIKSQATDIRVSWTKTLDGLFFCVSCNWKYTSRQHKNYLHSTTSNHACCNLWTHFVQKHCLNLLIIHGEAMKEPPILIGQEIGWLPESVWKRRQSL